MPVIRQDSQTNLWSNLLREALTKQTVAKNVVILGDEHQTKSQILKNIVGQADVEPLGVNFHYFEEQMDDVIYRVDLWGIHQTHLVQLLPHLPPNLVIIALDWNKPWTFVESLNRWFSVVKSMQGVEGEKLESLFKSPESTELPDGTLLNNLGIPIIVVACNAEVMNQFESQRIMNDDQIEHIQQALRTICLKYGAALFYTTQKSQPHLQTYVRHLLMEIDFHVKPQIAERDAVLVPVGWDRWGKIKTLDSKFDCQRWSTLDEGQLVKTYKTLISSPYAEVKKEALIQAEDDQTFLQKCQEILQEQAKNVTEEKEMEEDTKIPEKPLLKSASTGLSSGDLGDVSARLKQLSARASSTSLTQSAGGSNNEVIANFFQNLLNKKGGSNTGATTRPTVHRPTRTTSSSKVDN